MRIAVLSGKGTGKLWYRLINGGNKKSTYIDLMLKNQMVTCSSNQLVLMKRKCLFLSQRRIKSFATDVKMCRFCKFNALAYVR